MNLKLFVSHSPNQSSTSNLQCFDEGGEAQWSAHLPSNQNVLCIDQQKGALHTVCWSKTSLSTSGLTLPSHQGDHTCCNFWPVFGCCALHMTLKIFVFFNFWQFLYFFHIYDRKRRKNTEKDDFDQRMACFPPFADWKYTTKGELVVMPTQNHWINILFNITETINKINILIMLNKSIIRRSSFDVAI